MPQTMKDAGDRMRSQQVGIWGYGGLYF